jgi:hypothetical protein
MYNCDFEMTYTKHDSNDIYQKELLKAFNMKSFNNKNLIKKINVLFNIFNSKFNDIFELIKKKYKTPFILDNFSCFQILFSWENLFKTHTFLQIYLKKNEINTNIILKHLLNI